MYIGHCYFSKKYVEMFVCIRLDSRRIQKCVACSTIFYVTFFFSRRHGNFSALIHGAG